MRWIGHFYWRKNDNVKWEIWIYNVSFNILMKKIIVNYNFFTSVMKVSDLLVVSKLWIPTYFLQAYQITFRILIKNILYPITIPLTFVHSIYFKIHLLLLTIFISLPIPFSILSLLQYILSFNLSLFALLAAYHHSPFHLIIIFSSLLSSITQILYSSIYFLSKLVY